MDIPKKLLSQAKSIGSSIQQLAMSFGVAFSAICIGAFHTHFHFAEFDKRGFCLSFLFIGLFTCFSSIIFSLLKKNDGKKASGN